MRIERLPLPGGLRVSEIVSSGRPVMIERLSTEGEVVMKMLGVELNYDTDGVLVWVVFSIIEFLNQANPEIRKEFGAGFWELVYRLSSESIELVVELNLVKMEMMIFRYDDRGREFLVRLDATYYDSKLFLVEIRGQIEEKLGVIGFQPEIGESRLNLGAGDETTIVNIGVPRLVDLSLLGGDIDLGALASFIKGKS